MARTLASIALWLLACSAPCGPGAAQPAAAQPAATAAAPPPMSHAATSLNTLVGYYSLTRSGADATQVLTLHLRGDGIATLKTATPGYTQTAAGTPVTPVYQTGTWTEKEGSAAVHFDMTSNLVDGVPTDQRHEAVEIAFALSGCTLKLSADPAKAYGSQGLTFTKQGCGA